MADMHVCLFGDPSVEIASVPVRFPSRSASSLFAFLLVGGSRRVPRSLLAGTFWPNLPETKARRRLSHTLWQITSALGDESNLIVAEPAVVAINEAHPSLVVDLWRFDHLVGAAEESAGIDRFAQMQEAASLVIGNLCEGIYDDWAIPVRERYRERHSHLLSSLVRAYKSRGNLDHALETARLVVESNPLSEEPQREVMRLLHLLGRTAEAVDHYDRLQALLSEEVGAEPEAETRALLGRLITQGDAPPAPPVTASPASRSHIVGRDPERNQLRLLLNEAIAGAGSVALVEGEPGIGKTRLLADLAESAEWRGFDVATVCCRPVAGPLEALVPAIAPLLPRLRVLQLAETLDSVWLAEMATHLPRLRPWLVDLPRLPSLGPVENQSRRTEAFVRTIAAGAAIRPLLLIIEDLHDADLETMAVLTALSRIASRTPMVVAVTVRPTQARSKADVWKTLVSIESGIRQRLSLLPLDQDSISALAFEAGVEIDSKRLATIHRETEGNPLFALEMIRAFEESEAEGTEVPVAPTVVQVISGRLGSISPSAKRALETVSVLQRQTTLNELEMLSSPTSLGALSADIEELVRRSLLSESGDDFAIPQEQVRRVVYDEMPEPQRISMHSLAARELAGLSAVSNAELAWHSEAATLEALAAKHHAAAAYDADEAAAYEQASTHFEKAIRFGWLDELTDAEKFDLLLRYETSLAVIGETEQRLATIDLLEATAPDPTRQGKARLRRIGLLSGLGRLEEAAASADELLQWAQDNADFNTIVSGVLERSRVFLEAGSATEALAMLERLDGGDDEPNLKNQIDIAVARARALQMVQRHEEAMESWATALAVATKAKDEVARVDALGMSGIAAAESGQVDLALDRIGEALDGSRQLGHQAFIAQNLMNRAAVLHHNDPGQALNDYQAADAIFAIVGSRRGQAFVAANVADLRQMLFGVDVLADACWRRALSSFAEMGNRAEMAHCELVAGRSAIAEGDLEAARSFLGRALEDSRAANRRFTEVQILAAIAQLDRAEGDLNEAAKSAKAAATMAEEIQAAQLLPGVYADQSAVELDLDHIEEALAIAHQGVEAIDAFSHSPHRPWWALHRAQHRANHLEARSSLAECHGQVTKLFRNLNAEDRKRAIERQPEFAMIDSAWEADQPQMGTVELPAVGAPTGRALGPADHVTVIWTISHPDDPIQASEARKAQLLRLTEEASAQGGSPSIDHLADALAVSRSTVRRTLANLRDDGVDLPTRGSKR